MHSGQGIADTRSSDRDRATETGRALDDEQQRLAQPEATAWKGTTHADGDRIAITLRGPSLPDGDGLDAFVSQRKLVDNKPPAIRRDGDALIVDFGKSEYFGTPPETSIDSCPPSACAAGASRFRSPHPRHPDASSMENAMTFRIVMLAAALTLAGPVIAKPVIDNPAPDFTVTDASGNTQSLSAYKGRIVVLEWNNPECPFVRKHYGAHNMQAQQAEAAAAGVVWLTVNSGAVGKQVTDSAAASAYVASNAGKEAAYLIDAGGKVGHAYDAKTTPHMYVIDKDGTLRYMGGIDSIASTDVADIPKATQYVRQALAELAAGKAISVPTSEPYGCSVKYQIDARRRASRSWPGRRGPPSAALRRPASLPARSPASARLARSVATVSA